MASSRVRVLLALVLVAGCAAPATPDGAAPAAEVVALACPDPCRVPVASPAYGTREPALAADPTDARHLVAASMTFATVGDAVGRLHLQVHETRDGGATWTTAPFALPDDPQGETYNAALAFLDDGTRLLAGVAVDGAYGPLGPVQGRARVFVARDGDVVMLADGRGVETAPVGVVMLGFDKPSLAVGGRTVVAAWSAREHTGLDQTMRLQFAASPDGGVTWRGVQAPALDGNAVSGAGVVTPAGVWAFPVAVFDDPKAVSERRFSCAVVVSEDEGASWLVRPLGDCAWVPSLAGAADLAVALPVTGDEGETVLLRRSKDLGATWSADIVVAAPEAAGATVPALALLDDDRALVTAFHPLPGGGTSYRATLVDGARTESIVLDARISREPRFLGNLFGLAPVPGGAVATWVSEADDVTHVAAARILT